MKTDNYKLSYVTWQLAESSDLPLHTWDDCSSVAASPHFTLSTYTYLLLFTSLHHLLIRGRGGANLGMGCDSSAVPASLQCGRAVASMPAHIYFGPGTSGYSAAASPSNHHLVASANHLKKVPHTAGLHTAAAAGFNQLLWGEGEDGDDSMMEHVAAAAQAQPGRDRSQILSKSCTRNVGWPRKTLTSRRSCLD